MLFNSYFNISDQLHEEETHVNCEEWAVARWVVHNFESCFDLSNQVCADGHTKPIKAKSLFLATTWKQ